MDIELFVNKILVLSSSKKPEDKRNIILKINKENHKKFLNAIGEYVKYPQDWIYKDNQMNKNITWTFVEGIGIKVLEEEVDNSLLYISNTNKETIKITSENTRVLYDDEDKDFPMIVIINKF